MKRVKFLLLFLLSALLPFVFVFIDSNTHKTYIKIATGGKEGAYYSYALKYKKELEKYGVVLKVVTTQGSIEAQKKLKNSEVDFAFIQSGIEDLKCGLFFVANIAYEPIWIFYRGDKTNRLSQLKDKNIAIGELQSGIYPVAESILKINGFDINSKKIKKLKNHNAYKALKEANITAMFYISSPDSKLLRSLIFEKNLHLFDFERANSYRQYFLNKDQNFHIVTLEKGGFDFEKDIPETKHRLLAKSTILLTKDMDDEIVRLFLKVAQKVHSHAGMFYDEHTFPNLFMSKLPIHPSAENFFKENEHYYEEMFDFWTAQSLNKLHNFTLLVLLPLVTLFAFFIEVIMPVMHWYGRRKIIRWYDKINEIDTDIQTLDLKETNRRKEQLQEILDLVRSQEDIAATHMEEFYTLQNQIVNILRDLQKRADYLLNG